MLSTSFLTPMLHKSIPRVLLSPMPRMQLPGSQACRQDRRHQSSSIAREIPPTHLRPRRLGQSH